MHLLQIQHINATQNRVEKPLGGYDSMRYTTIHFRRSPISKPHASWIRPSNDEFTDPCRSIMHKFPYLNSERYGSLNYATHTLNISPSPFNIFFSLYLSVFFFSPRHRNS